MCVCLCAYSFKSGVRVDKRPAAAATSWKHRGDLTQRAALQSLLHMQQVEDITCKTLYLVYSFRFFKKSWCEILIASAAKPQ